MLYMVTFTINIPQMWAYIPYMDPMGIVISVLTWNCVKYCRHAWGIVTWIALGVLMLPLREYHQNRCAISGGLNDWCISCTWSKGYLTIHHSGVTNPVNPMTLLSTGLGQWTTHRPCFSWEPLEGPSALQVIPAGPLGCPCPSDHCG